MITPTRHVIIPVTNSAPPPMKTGRSFAQANTLPERIVRRQELAAAAVSTGPRMTIIIPTMKMTDLKSSSPREAIFREMSEGMGGFLILCYYSPAFMDIAERSFPDLACCPVSRRNTPYAATLDAWNGLLRSSLY